MPGGTPSLRTLRHSPQLRSPNPTLPDRHRKQQHMKIQPLPFKISNDTLVIGESDFTTTITFHRTLRIPDNNDSYPLPPSLGRFPIRLASAYKNTVPEEWLAENTIFIPIHQREAMWLSFDSKGESIIKVGVGNVNVVTGKEWKDSLDREKQDYMVLPNQPWIDGINDGIGRVKQFVAMPHGEGYTVEGQVTGKEDVGGMQIVVMNCKEEHRKKVELKRSRSLALQIKEKKVQTPQTKSKKRSKCMSDSTQPSQLDKCSTANKIKVAELGIAAGGSMTQKIYPDPNGVDYWEDTKMGKLKVKLVSPKEFTGITGERITTEVDENAYKMHKYPWFKLYNEPKGTVDGSDVLLSVKSVKQLDVEKGKANSLDDVPDSLMVHSIKM